MVTSQYDGNIINETKNKQFINAELQHHYQINFRILVHGIKVVFIILFFWMHNIPRLRCAVGSVDVLAFL
jgi:hypothetical protein